MVRFTPNGWSVISRQRLISLARSSGVGWVRPVRMPRAPALETADASSARPTHCMPPCTIGCLTPNISVKRVLIIRFPTTAFCGEIRPDFASGFECRVERDVGLQDLRDGAAGLGLVGELGELGLVGAWYLGLEREMHGGDREAAVAL